MLDLSKTRQLLSAREFGLVLLLGLLWGSPYALTKIALVTIPPLTLVVCRLAVAAAVLWLIVIIRRHHVPKTLRFARDLLIQSTVSCVVPYTLITLGQKSVDSGLAAILNSAIPIFVCLISVLWTRHEAMTGRRVFGVFCGFAGVVGIVGSSALSGLGRDVLGQAAIIAATISSALGVINGRRLTSVPPEVVVAAMLTTAAALLAPFCFVWEAPWQVSPSIPSLAALMVNAVFATGIGFILYFRLIRTVGSMGTASTSYLKPAVGVLIGCGFLGEPLTFTLIVGLIAILAGVVAINMSDHNDHAGAPSSANSGRS